MQEALYLKYRPKKLESVIGQPAAVRALRSVITNKGAHAFLLTGPSGVGKTTIARIAAKMLGCELKNPRALLEVDAATNTGIDDMRGVQDLASASAWSLVRAVIIDEAHGLSKQAWDSLLKVIEEPPENLYWFFCTTNAGKVPQTVKTRCAHIGLKEITDAHLEQIIDDVCEKEGIEISRDIENLVIMRAKGSARQALVNLSLCRDAKNKAEAAKILEIELDSDPGLELCRFVADGRGSWVKAMDLYNKLNGQSPEGVRIQMRRYLDVAIRNAKTDEQAIKYLTKLEAFDGEYNPTEGSAPLMQSLARALFS